MTAFEFAFALFGLLIGLCIAEIFGGLGRAFEARKNCEVGWLTPLLGGFVLIDLLGVWSGLWESRTHVAASPILLMAGALWAGAYYLAAYVTFPRELKSGCNLDEHFFTVRRLVLGISAATLVMTGLNDHLITRVAQPQDAIVNAALFLPTYSLAVFARSRRWVAAALIALILINLLGALTHTLNVQT